MLAEESPEAALRTTAARGRAAVRDGGSGTSWGTGGSGSCTSWSTAGTTVSGGSRTGRSTGRTAVGSRSCTSWGTTSTGSAIGGRSTVGGGSRTGRSTSTIRRRTATSRSRAAIAAWRLDVRAAALIRVDRRATRLDDHGFTTCRSARRGAAGLRGAAAPLMAMQQPGVRQAGHAHRGEHSTSHLDPSHRAKSPSLGNLEPGSSRPMERRCWSAEEFQAALMPPATRVAVQAAVTITPSRSIRPSNVRPSTDCFGQQRHRHRNPLTAHAAITMGALRQLHLAGLDQWIGATGTTP